MIMGSNGQRVLIEEGRPARSEHPIAVMGRVIVPPRVFPDIGTLG
jgi:hypothetical protein